jgi:hypothetical protein
VEGARVTQLIVGLAAGAAAASGNPWAAWQVVAAYSAAAYVDSQVIGSMLSPGPINGPRIGSLELNTSDEGAPVQEPYGRIARAAGHILDVSELIEYQNTTTPNGKGGAGGQYVEFTYAVHAMVSFGLGPADRVSKIRANGRIIYNEAPDVDITSTSITGAASNVFLSTGVGVYSFSAATWNSGAGTLAIQVNVPPGFASGPGGLAFDYAGIVLTDPGTTGLTTNEAISVVFGTGSGGTYTLYLNASQTSGSSSGTISGYIYDLRLTTPTYSRYLLLTSPPGGPDLSAVIVGGSKLSLIEPSAQAGTYTVVESGSRVDGETFCRIKKSGSAFSNITAGTTVQIHQDNPQWSPKVMGSAPEFHRSPTTGKLGSHDQPIDTLFESLRGTGEVPAYRGKIVVTFENLQLLDFGNTLPQFEADIVQDEAATVGSFLEQQALDAGFGADEVDASAITTPLLGYTVRGPQDVRQKMSPLMLAYELMTWEDAGTLRFFYRADAEEYALDAEMLSAHEPGSTAARPVRFSDGDDDPPARVVVRYTDEDRDSQVGSQQGLRGASAANETQTIDLTQLVMEASDAKALAVHTAWLAPVNRRTVEFNVPISLVSDIREGIRVIVTIEGRQREILLLGVDRGPNGVLECNGILEQSHIFELAPEPDFGGAPIGSLLGGNTQHPSGTAQPILWAALDLPPLSNDHVAQPGLYIAATIENAEDSFNGAALFQASDEDGESWSQVLRIRSAAVMGIATELASGDTTTWDDASTVDVVLFNGELESIGELACLNGGNRALIGGEIVGFRSAELIATNTYRLSGFLRGLRGTTANTTHVANELFVLLTGPGIHFLPLEASSIGMPKQYKLLTTGMRLGDAEQFEYTCSGRTVTPFAPTHVEGVRDVSDNITITWTRVTRSTVRLLSPQAVPLNEPFERWEVDVIDASGTVLRTISTATNAASYTAAQQTTDGLTPGDDVRVLVYQIGDTIQRGEPAEATL